MLHRLCEPPSIPLSFSLATILPRRGTYHFRFGSEPMSSPLPSTHRLGPGLPGYLIPFAPLAFAPQRQMRSSVSLSPPEFLPISTHFTAPPEVPHAPTSLQAASIEGYFPVEPKDFTPDLVARLRAL
jgi:hypothetical protein